MDEEKNKAAPDAESIEDKNIKRIEDNFTKFISQLDIRDFIVMGMLILLVLLYVYAQNGVTACNNYWLAQTSQYGNMSGLITFY
jgi:hypothetical protein